ncbi:hypothetical protein EVAR_17158_1 [Eumeta japonica]|uniref:Uncharacterized protein n=1 Tax=Eumeta variegata TaxID=151549 RepID=A0A4C1UA90_EUMVA|nr:hypothetical protein EVAR_17158_1 [Eumeta japonica]
MSRSRLVLGVSGGLSAGMAKQLMYKTSLKSRIPYLMETCKFLHSLSLSAPSADPMKKYNLKTLPTSVLDITEESHTFSRGSHWDGKFAIRPRHHSRSQSRSSPEPRAGMFYRNLLFSCLSRVCFAGFYFFK